jgi:Transcription factor WhiB
MVESHAELSERGHLGLRPYQPILDMELAYPPKSWKAYGTCSKPEFIAEHGIDFMFPEGFGPRPVKEQKAVCEACPVQQLCREEGFHEPFGIWGGLTRPERVALGGADGKPWDPKTGQSFMGVRENHGPKKGTK